MKENKWTTITVSKETSELLKTIKEVYGVNKSFAVEKALKEKYAELLVKVEV